MSVQLRTYADIARYLGITSATVSGWARKGWLATQGPWSPAEARAAADRSRQRAGRGSTAPHGTPSRWRAGCTCHACRRAHSHETRTRRAAARLQWWQTRQAPLLQALADGAPWADALAEAGVSSQAVHAHRKRSPQFAADLDRALMAGRDPRLDHGRAGAWRAGCRCPECRAHHESTRQLSSDTTGPTTKETTA